VRRKLHKVPFIQRAAGAPPHGFPIFRSGYPSLRGDAQNLDFFLQWKEVAVVGEQVQALAKSDGGNERVSRSKLGTGAATIGSLIKHTFCGHYRLMKSPLTASPVDRRCPKSHEAHKTAGLFDKNA
jgi:hypothetical protein